MKGSAPPLKLVWFEAVTDWLATRPDLAVTRSAMNQVVAMVLRATRTDTNQAMVSVRWVETMTGVNRGTVGKALAELEAHGWLTEVVKPGKALHRNRVKTYHILIHSSVTSGDTSSPRSGDTSSPPDPKAVTKAVTNGASSGDTFSHTPVTPGTPSSSIDGITTEMVEKMAMERAIAKGARSPVALARKIAREDRAELEAEARDRIRHARTESDIARCQRCDKNGNVEIDENTLAKCIHPNLVPV